MSGWLLFAVVALVLSVRAFYKLMWPTRRSSVPDWIWAPDEVGHWRSVESTGPEHGTYSEFLPVIVAQGGEHDGIYHIPMSGGTYQVDGVEDGIEFHTGPLSPDVNWWELNEP